MKLCEARQIVAVYDSFVSELSKFDIEIEEESGYSDRHYYFIGIRHKNASDWIFTTEDFWDFVKLVEVYLIGRGSNNA